MGAFFPRLAGMMLAVMVGLGSLAAQEAVPSTPPPPAPAPAADPQAEKVVDDLGKFYAALPGFQVDFKAVVQIDGNGMKNEMESTYAVAMSRPNLFAIVHQSGFIGGSLLSDGKTVILYQPALKKYTSTPAPSRLSSIVDPMDLAMAMGGSLTVLPTLVAADPAKSLTKGETGLAYVGKEEIDGVSAHHLRLAAPSTTTDLWISSGNAPLLLKTAIAVDTQVPAAALGKPGATGTVEMKLVTTSTFSHWRTGQPIPPETFVFQPPADAKQVDDFLAGLRKEKVHPLVGKPALDFEVKDLEGRAVSLASLKGKVVVLDFWATWCPPCCKALPVVSATALAWEKRGVAFYAVNVKETAEVIRSFLKENELAIPVLLDADGKVSTLYQAKAIPETVVIGRDGVIQAVHVGYRSNIGTLLNGQLAALLDGKSLIAAPTAAATPAPGS